MEFPLIKSDELNAFPKEPLCPICKRKKVWKPHNFVSLMGGAMRLNKKRTDSLSSKDLYGCLSLVWHGHHYDDVDDPKRFTYFVLDLVEESDKGDFEFYFCSTKCLRKFFDVIVDELEKRVRDEYGIEIDE